jgi:predicted nuclease of predicted toxin-antitoxin system
MRFLVDECTGPHVARWLREAGHEVLSVYEEARGASDDVILAQAFSENWILITNDKDFGEKVFKEQHPHCGVVFLRLISNRAADKIEVIQRLLESYADRLPNEFVVVTETQVRFARK